MPDLALWYQCNNNCIFCSNPTKYIDNTVNYNYDFGSVTKRLLRFKQGKDEFKSFNKVLNSFTLTGGEPTLNPDFFKIIDFINKNFPNSKINLLTNGRIFNYYDYVKKCLVYPSLYYQISLHGYNDFTHDKITRTLNSFRQTIKGINNLLIAKIPSSKITVRIIVHRLNYLYLDKIIEFLVKNFPKLYNIVLIFIEYEGQALRNFKEISVTYEKCRRYLRKLKRYIKKLNFSFYHFPLCVMDYELWPYVYRTLDSCDVTFLNRCKECNYKKFCLGIHKEYLKKFGSIEFNPVKAQYDIVETNNWHHPIKIAKKTHLTKI